MERLFTGTGVALVTPFDDERGVDLNAYGRILEYVIEGGVDYLVPLGSTGEAATLSEEEQRKILDFVIERNDGRLPVLAGNFGGTDTAALRRKIKDYDFSGIDGILSASPSYVKPSQEGIFRHYMALAEQSSVPVMIYNVPGRTHSNISAETTLRLSREGNAFAGIKEASGDLGQTIRILRDRPDNFTVCSGDDETALALMAAGGDGVISVIANAFPEEFSEMTKAAMEGKMARANELNRALYNIHPWLYVEGNPVGIKGAMEILGYCKRTVRLPLWPMSDSGMQKLKAEIDILRSD